MSLFLPNIPTSSQNLDFSQGQLLSNNQGLDTVFGVEHYKFSDATVNKGLHNTVTQPLIVGSAHPTTTTNPIIYAMQDSAKIGVLQYSRGPTDAIPSPITFLQSPATALTLAVGATTNVLDFTGITNLAIATLHAYDKIGGAASIDVFWNGAAFNFINYSTSGNTFSAVASGSILQLKNTSLATNYTNTYWTLIFYRIQA